MTTGLGLGLAPVVPLASLPLPPLRSLECSYGCWRIVQEVLSQDSGWQTVNTPGQRGWYFYVHRKCFAIYVTVHQFPLLSPLTLSALENWPREVRSQHSCCLVICMASSSARPLFLSTQPTGVSAVSISAMLGDSHYLHVPSLVQASRSMQWQQN